MPFVSEVREAKQEIPQLLVTISPLQNLIACPGLDELADVVKHRVPLLKNPRSLYPISNLVVHMVHLQTLNIDLNIEKPSGCPDVTNDNFLFFFLHLSMLSKDKILPGHLHVVRLAGTVA